jgi:hypothetical protein
MILQSPFAKHLENSSTAVIIFDYRGACQVWSGFESNYACDERIRNTRAVRRAPNHASHEN